MNMISIWVIGAMIKEKKWRNGKLNKLQEQQLLQLKFQFECQTSKIGFRYSHADQGQSSIP